MTKFKYQSKFKISITNFVIWYLLFVLILEFVLCHLNLSNLKIVSDLTSTLNTYYFIFPKGNSFTTTSLIQFIASWGFMAQ